MFNQHCTQCHGDKLQGQAGPPLAGPKFESNLEYSKMSARQMFDFIKTQMPYNAPGGLTKKRYLRALSYILSKNGYRQGSAPLSEKTLGQIKLLPYPGKHGGSHSQARTQSQQPRGDTNKDSQGVKTMNGLLRTLVATGDRVRPHGLALGVSAAALALLLQTPTAHA